MIIVLDTGGVEGLAPIDEERRARLRLLREGADDLVLPAAVLAESVLTGDTGHDYHVRRLLEVVDVADVDATIGHAAGALRRVAMGAGMNPPPSGVDAVVASTADGRATNDDVLIVTSDDGDFQLSARWRRTRADSPSWLCRSHGFLLVGSLGGVERTSRPRRRPGPW